MGEREPITISLCMIVKNEEEVLARCLDCAGQFADEIVVVDTGSADRTVEIARAYTDRIFHFPWVDDFAAARNFSFSHATCDYIMWLDADDVVDEENTARLQELKRTLPREVDAVLLRYNTGFDEAGRPIFHYYRERLVRRNGGFAWREPVHEYIALHGNIRELDIAITHGHREREASDRNLRIYERYIAQGEALSTRGLYYYARELATHGRQEEAAERYRQFLGRPDGWVEDRISACAGLADCLLALGREEEALEALCRSFVWDLPRGEVCCRIASIRQRRGETDQAAYWYSLVLDLPRPEGWGFLSEDYWGFIPHVQLCVLYDKAGDRERALAHHRQARALRPRHPSVLHNEAYFSREMGEGT